MYVHFYLGLPRKTSQRRWFFTRSLNRWKKRVMVISLEKQSRPREEQVPRVCSLHLFCIFKGQQRAQCVCCEMKNWEEGKRKKIKEVAGKWQCVSADQRVTWAIVKNLNHILHGKRITGRFEGQEQHYTIFP